jgi:hypothetical protein
MLLTDVSTSTNCKIIFAVIAAPLNSAKMYQYQMEMLTATHYSSMSTSGSIHYDAGGF